MPLNWTELALLVIAAAFVCLVVYVIRLAQQARETLGKLTETLATTQEAVAATSQQLGPVLTRLSELEHNVDASVVEVKDKVVHLETHLVEALGEVQATAKAYEVLGRTVEAKMESDIGPILQDVQAISRDVKDVTGLALLRIRQMEDFFEAAREAGVTVRAVTDIARGGLTGLAVQMASMATGVKSSLEFLSENLLRKGGGEK